MTQCFAGPLSTTLLAHTEHKLIQRDRPQWRDAAFKVNTFILASSRTSLPPPLTGSRSPVDLEGCDNRCPPRLRENEQRVWQMRVWRVSSSAGSLLDSALTLHVWNPALDWWPRANVGHWSMTWSYQTKMAFVSKEGHLCLRFSAFDNAVERLRPHLLREEHWDDAIHVSRADEGGGNLSIAHPSRCVSACL